MRTICTPSYTNIFMGKVERNFIYPCLKTFCCQFIDDIFLPWDGIESQLLQA